MKTKQFILLGIIFLLLFYCNPKAILTGVTHTSDVDSVLFYQQNPLPDPLLDGIKSNPGDSARITALILPPPPPPPPDYREIQGFRIQLFAGTDSMGAATIKQKADSEVDDMVYLLNEGGLFKIQIGDYPYRMDADNMKIALDGKGFEGAWVVKRLIRVSQDSNIANINTAPPPVPPETQYEDTTATQSDDTVSASNNEALIKIQVIATSDEMKARQLEMELETQFSEEAFYIQSGDVYKVYIGKFQNRPDAEKLLKYIREKGYTDAWLVY